MAQLRPKADANVSKLALHGHARGRLVRYGGLPGLQYRIRLAKPSAGRSRLVFLYDGRTEYAFNCQSTPQRRLRLVRACNQVLRTLKVRQGAGAAKGAQD